MLNTNKSNEIDAKTKRRNSLEIKVVSARLGCAKEKLDEDKSYMFRIFFTRKNTNRGIIENFFTKKVILKDSLMYFGNEVIKFTEVDIENDIMEISFAICKDMAKRFKPLVICFKNLKFGEEKEEIWTLSMQSLINLKYILSSETIRDPLAEVTLQESAAPGSADAIRSINLTSAAISVSYSDNARAISQISTVSKYLNSNQVPSASLNLCESPTKSPNRFRTNEEFKLTNLSDSKAKGNSQSILFFNKSIIKKSSETSSLSCANNQNSNLIPMTASISNVPQNLFNLNKEEKKVSIDCLNMGSLLNRSYEILEGSNINEESSTAYSPDKDNSDKEYDTFCQSIYISGLPFNNVNIVPDSEDYPAPCGHSECSILCAFKPEVLHSYQNENRKFQIGITNLTSFLCFPLGIKLCFACIFDEKKVTNLPTPYHCFMNVITNEKGERFYTVSVYYFKKLTFHQFEKEFKINPIKEFTKFQFLLAPDDSSTQNLNSNRMTTNSGNRSLNSIGKKIGDSLQVISKFIINEDILIPECITLVSRFPYIKQMSACLQTILRLDCLEMNKLIVHLTNEIPVPPKDKTIFFYIPRTPRKIEIHSPFMKDHSSINSDSKILFEYFSIENIIIIFNLILLEQKILFVDNDYSRLSEISLTFISLIYPFAWVNPFVPVLSLSSVKFLQSIIPFIMGIDECLMKIAQSKQYIDDQGSNNQIVYVYIKENYIDVNSNKKGNKLNIKSLMRALNLPEMPEQIWEELISELKSLKKILSDKKCKGKLNNQRVEKTIKEIFTKAMVMMIGDYKNSMFMAEDDMPLFNNEGFLSHRSKAHREFYQELISSQLFNQFLLNEGKMKLSKYKKEETHYGYIYDNMAVDTTYFNKLCLRYNNLINTDNTKRSSTKVRSSSVSHKAIVMSEGKMKDEPKTMNIQMNIHKHQDESSFRSETVNLSLNGTTMSNTINNPKKKLSQDNNRSKSKDSFEECEIKEFDKFLIVPYFINHPLVKYDNTKIEKLLSDQIQTKPLSNTNELLPEYIIIGHINYQLNMIKDSCRRYSFLNTNMNANSNSNSNSTQNHNISVSKRKANSSSQSPNKKRLDTGTFVRGSAINHTNEKNRQEIKTKIFECFRSICTSEPIKTSNFSGIELALSTPFGRKYFVSLIYQKEESTHKHLSAWSFKDLLRIVAFTLNHFEDAEFESIRFLTKVIMYYYTVTKTKDSVYLFQELVPKRSIKSQALSYPCKYWTQEEFWLNWFECEIQEQSTCIDPSDQINFYFATILKVSSVMVKLKISENMAKKVLIETIGAKYLCNNSKDKANSSLLTDLEKSITKEYQHMVNDEENNT